MNVYNAYPAHRRSWSTPPRKTCGPVHRKEERSYAQIHTTSMSERKTSKLGKTIAYSSSSLNKKKKQHTHRQLQELLDIVVYQNHEMTAVRKKFFADRTNYESSFIAENVRREHACEPRRRLVTHYLHTFEPTIVVSCGRHQVLCGLGASVHLFHTWSVDLLELRGGSCIWSCVPDILPQCAPINRRRYLHRSCDTEQVVGSSHMNESHLLPPTEYASYAAKNPASV